MDRVEHGGAFATVLIEREASRFHDSRDIALLNELVLGVLRQRSVLDHVIEAVATRPLHTIDADLRYLLRIGAYSILFLDRVPAFAAVDTAVQLARQTRSASGAGFVNAVLRRVAAEGTALLPPEPQPGDVEGLARWSSHPPWWIQRLVSRIGWESALRLATANNQPAATVLCTRLSRIRPDALIHRLADEGVRVEACRFSRDALRVQSGVATKCAAFREGMFWIQDEGSQLAGLLAAETRGARAADLCAAPGGKTLLLADRLPVGGIVIAVDRHVGRLGRLIANLERLGEDRVLAMAADSSVTLPLRGKFDPVLVDAPCSGTGTLRRHPEIRWRLRAEDLPALAGRQGRILDSAAGILPPGGRLVYSVCSIEPEEGEEVVTGFLRTHREFERVNPRDLLPAEAHSLVGEDCALRTTPLHDGLDGFFAAVVRKR